jgi:hypothetical protein
MFPLYAFSRQFMKRMKRRSKKTITRFNRFIIGAHSSSSFKRPSTAYRGWTIHFKDRERETTRKHSVGSASKLEQASKLEHLASKNWRGKKSFWMIWLRESKLTIIIIAWDLACIRRNLWLLIYTESSFHNIIFLQDKCDLKVYDFIINIKEIPTG